MATRKKLSRSTEALIKEARDAINRDLEKLGEGEITEPMRRLLTKVAEGLPDGPSRIVRASKKVAMKKTRRR